MEYWAVIPVKSFALGKSRLSAVLGVEQRAALNRRLFGRVLNAALANFRADRVAVVTSDAFLLALVRGQGLHGLEDDGSGLNAALALAGRHALSHGARGMTVLPSDLPGIAADDVAALVNALGNKPGCVIAPDQQEQGTNALALSPLDPDFFRFGPDSFQAHLGAAKARGLKPRILRRPGLAQDLDTPENYRRYAKEQIARAGVPA